MPNAATTDKLKGLLDKLAMEIVMAEPGTDSGQIPILDLINNLKDEAQKDGDRTHFHAACEHHFKWMVTIVESGKPFVAEQLVELNAAIAKLKDLLQNPTTPFQAPASPAPSTAAVAAKSQPQAAAPAAGSDVLPEETALVMNLESDGELLREFVNESQEHLSNIEQGVLVLEEKPDDADTLSSVFRAFHTFKGGAGFLNLIPINRLAHILESLLDLARTGKIKIDSSIIELILQGGDTLKQFVTEMEAQLSGKKPAASFAIPTEALKARVRAVVEGTPAPAEAPAPAAAAAPSPTPAAPAVETTPAPAAPVSTPAPAAPTPAAAPAPAVKGKPAGAPGHAAPPGGGAVVKVDTFKLDSLVDLVGELVISQSLVAQNPELKGNTNQHLVRSLSQLGRITKELQRIAMSMRMVPISGTFQKMTRIVRDIAAKQQKQVQLVMTGEDTELDRTIVEEINDPLMHMIRNSVDHGIEKTEVRTAAGKPAQGTIHLRAFHQGGNIVIQIQDDGGGLNKERILKKAMEKGLVTPGTELTDSEIFQFIFAAGFSTAEVVTDISGRGVGMDVVRRNIEKLRGKIEIESSPGKGSTFTIYLPLTLAIIEGLIVSVGEQRYIVPTLSVRESFRPNQEMIATVYERGEMVKVRGRLIPLLRMCDHFGIKPKSNDPAEGIIIVIESGQDARCLLVDDLLGKQEVVIKSLGESFKDNHTLAGGAILGDGRVGLILDPSALVRHEHNKNISMAA